MILYLEVAIKIGVEKEKQGEVLIKFIKKNLTGLFSESII